MVSEGGKKKTLHKKKGKVLIAEESFRLKRAILHYHSVFLFKDPQWSSVLLSQSRRLFVAF